jgi:Na+-translocating ferredoxin:NAD+ oxidoreductase RnfE subunit
LKSVIGSPPWIAATMAAEAFHAAGFSFACMLVLTFSCFSTSFYRKQGASFRIPKHNGNDHCPFSILQG